MPIPVKYIKSSLITTGNAVMGLLNAVRGTRFLDTIVIELSPSDFLKLAGESKGTTIIIHSIVSSKRFLSHKADQEQHEYILPLQGVIFFCKCEEEIKLPEEICVVNVRNFKYPAL